MRPPGDRSAAVVLRRQMNARDCEHWCALSSQVRCFEVTPDAAAAAEDKDVEEEGRSSGESFVTRL